MAVVIEGGQAIVGRPRHSNVVPGAVCACNACCVVADPSLILHDGDAPAFIPPSVRIKSIHRLYGWAVSHCLI